MIRAILWAQVLSIRGFRLGSSRPAAIFSLIVGLIWYGFWALIAGAAYLFTSEPESLVLIHDYLPAGFLVAFLYWQVAPLMSATLGASLDFHKLAAYPIPHRKLFLVEVLLRFTTCGEILLVLLGALAGLVRNPVLGGWPMLLRMAAPSLLFVAFNVLLAAGLRNIIERLLARKRVREVMVLLLVVVLGLPRLLFALGVRFGRVEETLASAGRLFWPWGALAGAILGRNYAAGVLVLTAWTAAALLFALWQFERNLGFDAQAAQATVIEPGPPRHGVAERFFRLPALLPDPLAAIVEKELRSLSRTPRFRTVFMMGFTFGLLVWLPLVIRRGHTQHSSLSENFLVLVSVYALTLLGQVSYWNSFGFDRSAAQVYFSLPVPVSQALAGKNLAAALFILLELGAVTLACLLLRVPIAALKILEAFVVTPVAALYLLALGNLASVRFPRPMNPERSAQGGAASRFQGLLFFFYPFALLPIFLAYLARYAFSSQLAFWAVLAFAALLGAAVYWIAMEAAVETARSRRELILAELSRGEGPVVSE